LLNPGYNDNEKREAERRQTRNPTVRASGRGRALGGARSPVGVPLRLLPARR